MKVMHTATPAEAHRCFRSLLQRELARRCGDNPQYSLRAFARSLEIDHATLSQLLRNKRRMTDETIQRLGARLGLERDTIDECLRGQPHIEAATAAAATTLDVQQLAQDAARVVTEWHHMALLELTHLKEFRADSRWIARVLDMGVDDVNLAITSLARLGMLEMASPDRWIDRSGNVEAGIEGFARATIERLVTQLRARSLAALRDSRPSLVHYNSTTLAFDTDQLPAVVQLIARLRTDLADLLRRSGPRDDVYQLDVCFFPLTTLRRTKENNNGTAGDTVSDPRQEA